MIFRKVYIENKSDLEFVEKLYIESFPSNERRSVLKMHHLIEDNDAFDVFVLVDKDTDSRIGFISLWTFDGFIYIEHFAVGPEHRNGGYGRRTVKAVIDKVELPIVTEIELPSSSDFAARRLKFYQNLGFEEWNSPYAQPPYEEGFEPVPMLLLTYNKQNTDLSYNDIVNQLYKSVYQKNIV